MDKFDLTVFKIGLETGLFRTEQLMRLIYGDLVCDKTQPDAFSVVWDIRNFNYLPFGARKQLVKMMRKYQPTSDLYPVREIDAYVNSCALCTLISMLQANHPTAVSDDGSFTAEFNIDTTPAICVKEIINWNAWGIELDDEVWQIALTTLNDFIADAPERETVYERVMAKKFALYEHEKELKKSINKGFDKIITSEDKLLKLENESATNFSKLMMTSLHHEMLSKEVEDLHAQLVRVHLKLGQAEIYHLVKRHYDV